MSDVRLSDAYAASYLPGGLAQLSGQSQTAPAQVPAPTDLPPSILGPGGLDPSNPNYIQARAAMEAAANPNVWPGGKLPSNLDWAAPQTQQNVQTQYSTARAWAKQQSGDTSNKTLLDGLTFLKMGRQLAPAHQAAIARWEQANAATQAGLDSTNPDFDEGAALESRIAGEESARANQGWFGRILNQVKGAQNRNDPAGGNLALSLALASHGFTQLGEGTFGALGQLANYVQGDPLSAAMDGLEAQRGQPISRAERMQLQQMYGQYAAQAMLAGAGAGEAMSAGAVEGAAGGIAGSLRQGLQTVANRIPGLGADTSFLAAGSGAPIASTAMHLGGSAMLGQNMMDLAGQLASPIATDEEKGAALHGVLTNLAFLAPGAIEGALRLPSEYRLKYVEKAVPSLEGQLPPGPVADLLYKSIVGGADPRDISMAFDPVRARDNYNAILAAQQGARLNVQPDLGTSTDAQGRPGLNLGGYDRATGDISLRSDAADATVGHEITHAIEDRTGLGEDWLRQTLSPADFSKLQDITRQRATGSYNPERGDTASPALADHWAQPDEMSRYWMSQYLLDPKNLSGDPVLTRLQSKFKDAGLDQYAYTQIPHEAAAMSGVASPEGALSVNDARTSQNAAIRGLGDAYRASLGGESLPGEGAQPNQPSGPAGPVVRQEVQYRGGKLYLTPDEAKLWNDIQATHDQRRTEIANTLFPTDRDRLNAIGGAALWRDREQGRISNMVAEREAAQPSSTQNSRAPVGGEEMEPQRAKLAMNAAEGRFDEVDRTRVSAAIKANPEGETMTGPEDHAEDARYYKLRGGEVYYGLHPVRDAEGNLKSYDIVSVLNNDKHAAGFATPATMLDAIERYKAMRPNVPLTLDAWNVHGFLPDRYARFGFNKVWESPYDVKTYGEPSDELKAAWRKRGWQDGEPYPSVARMEYDGRAGGRDAYLGARGAVTEGGQGASGGPEGRLSGVRGEPAPQGREGELRSRGAEAEGSSQSGVAKRDALQRTLGALQGATDDELRRIGIRPERVRKLGQQRSALPLDDFHAKVEDDEHMSALAQQLGYPKDRLQSAIRSFVRAVDDPVHADSTNAWVLRDPEINDKLSRANALPVRSAERGGGRLPGQLAEWSQPDSLSQGRTGTAQRSIYPVPEGYEQGPGPNRPPWTSKLIQLLESKLRGKEAPVQDVRNILRNGGVTEDEINHSGIMGYLDGYELGHPAGSVRLNVQDLLQHVGNQLPRLSETRLVQDGHPDDYYENLAEDSLRNAAYADHGEASNWLEHNGYQVDGGDVIRSGQDQFNELVDSAHRAVQRVIHDLYGAAPHEFELRYPGVGNAVLGDHNYRAVFGDPYDGGKIVPLSEARNDVLERIRQAKDEAQNLPLPRTEEYAPDRNAEIDRWKGHLLTLITHRELLESDPDDYDGGVVDPESLAGMAREMAWQLADAHRVLQEGPETGHILEEARYLKSLGAEENQMGDGPTQYEDYMLPGGHNYQELLLKVPGIGYRAPHFGEYAKNIVVHGLFDERQIPGHGDALFVHEIQSDLHQAGRKTGYREESSDIGKPPKAPFEKTWPGLMFRRLLDEAVSKDKDSIAWSSGNVRAAAYNKVLADRVDRIEAQPSQSGGDYHELIGYKDHSQVFHRVVPGGQLDDMLGSRMAGDYRAHLAAETERTGSIANADPYIATGDNMTIGGAGMRAFYDEMLPQWVGKYVRQWGGKVEQAEIPDGKVNGSAPGWVVDITPQMRESVMTHGQPLFQKSLLPFEDAEGPPVQERVGMSDAPVGEHAKAPYATRDWSGTQQDQQNIGTQGRQRDWEQAAESLSVQGARGNPEIPPKERMTFGQMQKLGSLLNEREDIIHTLGLKGERDGINSAEVAAANQMRGDLQSHLESLDRQMDEARLQGDTGRLDALKAESDHTWDRYTDLTGKYLNLTSNNGRNLGALRMFADAAGGDADRFIRRMRNDARRPLSADEIRQATTNAATIRSLEAQLDAYRSDAARQAAKGLEALKGKAFTIADLGIQKSVAGEAGAAAKRPIDLLTDWAEDASRRGVSDPEAFRREVQDRFGVSLDGESAKAIMQRGLDQFQRPNPIETKIQNVKRQQANLHQKVLATTFNEFASGLWKAGLISSPRAISAPLVGGTLSRLPDAIARVPSSIIDSLMELRSGKRTVSLAGNLQSEFQAWNKATRGAILDKILKGSTPEDLATGGATHRLNYQPLADKGVGKAVNTVTRGLSSYANKVFDLHAAAAQGPSRAGYARGLIEAAWLDGHNAGLRGDEQSQYVASHTMRPTPEAVMEALAKSGATPESALWRMAEHARQSQQQATYTNTSRATKAMSGISNLPGLGPLLVPFPKVPTNRIARGLEYTPAGTAYGVLKALSFLRTGDPTVQPKAATALGRSLTGAGLAYAGYLAAEHGWITPPTPASKSERDTEEALGRQGSSIRIGDRWWRADEAAQLAPAIMGAEIARMQQARGKNPGMSGRDAAVRGSLNFGLGQIQDTPALQGPSNLLDTVQQLQQGASQGGTNLGDALLRNRFVAGIGGGIVPAAIKDAVMAPDRYVRGDNSFTSKLAASTPLRYGMTPQVDALGTPIEKPTWFAQEVRGLGPDQAARMSDPLRQNLDRLGVQVQKPGRVSSLDRPERDVTQQDYDERKQVYGGTLDRYLREALRSPYYQNLTTDADRKAELLATKAEARKDASAQIKDSRAGRTASR